LQRAASFRRCLCSWHSGGTTKRHGTFVTTLWLPAPNSKIAGLTLLLCDPPSLRATGTPQYQV
jgi:hypothetical protein